MDILKRDLASLTAGALASRQPPSLPMIANGARQLTLRTPTGAGNMGNQNFTSRLLPNQAYRQPSYMPVYLFNKNRGGI